MILPFAKMHGLGNDFVVLDGVSQGININDLDIKSLGNRHLGIGFDQLLIIEPPKTRDVDFHYRIFNADGSEVEQCGNGARCFGRFVRDQGLTWKNKIKVATHSGTISIKLESNGAVSVNMGIPRWQPKQIPINAAAEEDFYQIDVLGERIDLSCVSIGNPHAVIRVDNILDSDVEGIGRALSEHEFFPDRANINFMQVVSNKEIKLRVFERGVGETQACGTGACASVAVGRKQGWLDAHVKVNLTGGNLSITSYASHKPIFMAGPAEFAFYGYLEL